MSQKQKNWKCHSDQDCESIKIYKSQFGVKLRIFQRQ